VIVDEEIVVVANVEVPVTASEAIVVVASVLVPATVNRPEFVVLAKLAVPVNVGDAERTKLPVPVTPVTSVIRVSSSTIVSRDELLIFPLKVVQSVEVRRPRAEALEFGIFKVTVPPRVDDALEKLRSVPVLVVANDNHGLVIPALFKVPVIDGV
jgi:hypothetical protein